MQKVFSQLNVYDAAQERIKFLFDEFDTINISFSGGKDSGVCLDLCYDYAIQNDMTDKLSMIYLDFEAMYQSTVDYISRCFSKYPEIKEKMWICIPITAQSPISAFQTRWTPWDPKEKDKWIYDLPGTPYLITTENTPFTIPSDMDGDIALKHICSQFAKTHGKTADIVGIRGDESLNRQSIVLSSSRRKIYKNQRWINQISKDHVSAYPIYDWKVEDVWTCISKYDYDYSRLYDLMYAAGVPLKLQRTASVYCEAGRKCLDLAAVLEPETWERMYSRIDGAQSAFRYGAEDVFRRAGFETYKPEKTTWEEYAVILLEILDIYSHERCLLFSSAVKSKLENTAPSDQFWKMVCKSILSYDVSMNFASSSRVKKQTTAMDDKRTKWRKLLQMDNYETD